MFMKFIQFTPPYQVSFWSNDETSLPLLKSSMDMPWNPYWRGRLSTVDLLVLTSLDQLIFILKILFTFITKQLTLLRRSTVLCLPLQLVFPGRAIAVLSRVTSLFKNVCFSRIHGEMQSHASQMMSQGLSKSERRGILLEWFHSTAAAKQAAMSYLFFSLSLTCPGKSNWRERLGMSDLLLLPSLNQLLFIIKIFLTYFTKQAIFMRFLNCTEPSLSVSIPWCVGKSVLSEASFHQCGLMYANKACILQLE